MMKQLLFFFDRIIFAGKMSNMFRLKICTGFLLFLVSWISFPLTQKADVRGFLLFQLLGTMSPQTEKVETFTLENGNTFEGEIARLDEDGFIVKLSIGGFSDLTELVYLSQETLRRLSQNPKYTGLVEPFIDLPEEDMDPPQINVRQPDRLILPEYETGFLASFASLGGGFFIFVFYVANLFSAFEVAHYRGRPAAMVCGLSVILPVITQIIFLSLPNVEDEEADHSIMKEDAFEEKIAPVPNPISQTSVSTSQTSQTSVSPSHVPGVPTMGQSKLGLKRSITPQKGTEAKVFTRSSTEFNRHFFETTFPEFFRVVASPSIKDMVLEFKGPKKEMVARRITRISASELHLQLIGGNKEMSMNFGEIIQVKLRHKDEK